MKQLWRMQLHPADPDESTKCCVESLAAGFVGLDFAKDTGDLRKADLGDLPSGQRDYKSFATKMRIGDLVLVMAHHFPFALARIAGDYNYIAQRDPRLGIWFRHFRGVDEVRYYADWKKDARKWPKLIMTDAISTLREESTQSAQLIRQWLRAI